MNENLQNQTELEIDLREIFFAVKKWIWAILLISFLSGLIAFGYSKFMIAPIYTAENSMLVLTRETTLASLADLQMGAQLTSDYKVLTTSRPVLEEVISNLKLKTTYDNLKHAITVTNTSGTRILKISVKNQSPEMALKIVRELSVVASDFIGDMMEVVPPKIIDEGVLPTAKTSPSNTRNTLLGILIGGVLSGGIVVLSAILDDTIKSEEEIEKFLGLSTLSTVPDRKDYVDSENNKKRKTFSNKFRGKSKKK